MKKEHLDFQFMPDLDCCYIYDKKGDELGQIIYHKPWDRWVFQPHRYRTDLEQDIIWSDDCLEAVAAKIKELPRPTLHGGL